MTRDQVRPLRLISGALMGFDFTREITKTVLDAWWRAFKVGLYRGTVSRHSGMEDHRGDETILGILTHIHGIKAHTISEHFGSDSENIQATTLLRSGYYDWPKTT